MIIKNIGFYLKEINQVKSNDTITTETFSGDSTVLTTLAVTNTTGSSFITDVYKGTIKSNIDNVIFTKTFKADVNSYYAEDPTVQITGNNQSNYIIEESENEEIIETSGFIGNVTSSLNASSSCTVESTKGILPGMLVVSKDGTTLAESNLVRVVSVDGPISLTLSSSSFSAPANTKLLFKRVSDSGKIFLKSFTIKYNNSEKSSLIDNDTIVFTRSVISEPSTTKSIRSFSMDKSELSSISQQRSFNIVGDAGAVFDIVITKLGELTGSSSVTDKTYDFTSDTFTTASTLLDDATIPASGIYSDTVTFPSVSSDDDYQFTITAGTSSVLDASEFGSSPSTPTFTITQRAQKTVTFTCVSTSNNADFSSKGSNLVVTGNTGDLVNFEHSFGLVSTDADNKAFSLIRQPLLSDFDNIGANGVEVEFNSLIFDVGITKVTTVATTGTTAGPYTALSGFSLRGLKKHSTASRASNIISNNAQTTDDIPSISLSTYTGTSGEGTYNTSQVFEAGEEITFNTSKNAEVTIIGSVVIGSANTTISLELDNIVDGNIT